MSYALEQPEWLRSRARATKSLHHFAWTPLYHTYMVGKYIIQLIQTNSKFLNELNTEYVFENQICHTLLEASSRKEGMAQAFHQYNGI